MLARSERLAGSPDERRRVLVDETWARGIRPVSPRADPSGSTADQVAVLTAAGLGRLVGTRLHGDYSIWRPAEVWHADVVFRLLVGRRPGAEIRMAGMFDHVRSTFPHDGARLESAVRELVAATAKTGRIIMLAGDVVRVVQPIPE
jgi:hypothetical protein